MGQDIAKCPGETKSPLVEKHCLRDHWIDPSLPSPPQAAQPFLDSASDTLLPTGIVCSLVWLISCALQPPLHQSSVVTGTHEQTSAKSPVISISSWNIFWSNHELKAAVPYSPLMEHDVLSSHIPHTSLCWFQTMFLSASLKKPSPLE